MLELMGIFYLAYSTYRITKVVSVVQAVLWFLATLAFYFIFVFGLTFLVTFVLAILQVPSYQFVSIVVAILSVLGAISVIYFVQDYLEEKIRIDLKSKRDSVTRKEQSTQLTPYVGRYLSMNYDSERALITRGRSSLPNGASLVLNYDNGESYFQNEVVVLDGEFRAVHTTTQYNYTIVGTVSDKEIVVRCDVVNNKSGDRTEISDTLTQVIQDLPKPVVSVV